LIIHKKSSDCKGMEEVRVKKGPNGKVEKKAADQERGKRSSRSEKGISIGKFVEEVEVGYDLMKKGEKKLVGNKKR